MNHTHRLPRILLSVAFAGVAVVGLGSCSDDKNKTTIEELGDDGGVDLPGDVAGLTDCQATLAKFIVTVSAAYDPTSNIDFDQSFGELSAEMPAELQDEMAVLFAAYHAFGEVVAANNDDMTSPEVQAASQQLNTPEVQAATDAVSNYFDTTCPT